MTVKRRSLHAGLWCATLICLGACSDEAAVGVAAPHKSPKPLHPAMTASVRPAVDTNPHGATQGSASKAPPMSRPAGKRHGLVSELALLELRATVPEGWEEVPSSSSMRLATVKVPRVDGDERDGEMSVTHLPGGGGLQANIDRWQGQFRERPQPITRTFSTGGEVRVTSVELSGTFDAGSGPMQTGGAPAPGTLLLAAIVEAPHGKGLVFFKAWGPQATMERWRASFEAFIDSLTHLH